MSSPIQEVRFYPPADPPGPDDDPDEVDTPVCIEFKEWFTDRIYEEILDGHMSLTEDEFTALREALNKAHRDRGTS